MPLYMETTKITPERTAAEIQLLLVHTGAQQIAMEFRDRKVVGLRWTMPVNGRDALFAMPVRTGPVYAILQRRRQPAFRSRKQQEDLEQAERVAWRQLLRWTQAQIALIETGMVQATEVFMPYMLTPAGRTLFELVEASGLPLLADRSTK
jgi:hypothetical protein